MNSEISTEKTAAKPSFDDIVLAAQAAPKILSDASAGEGDDISRDIGLVLTKKDIINIKIYEAAALALPYTPEGVQNYLKFGDAKDGGPGLAYKDFLNTFTLTRNHALRWAPLNDEIRLISTKLNIFSSRIIIYGDSMKKLEAGITNSKEIADYFEAQKITSLAQLVDTEVISDKHFPGIPLKNGVKKDLEAYLSLIFDEVEAHLIDTDALAKNIIKFSDDLTNHVLPKVKVQTLLVSNNTLDADIKTIKDSIDERDLRIEEKNQEYVKLVKQSFDSLGTGFFGLGMAIYNGVEAENTRAARNLLKEEQKRDIEKLGKKNQTLASLLRIKAELDTLSTVTFDAHEATKNLRSVWNSVAVFLKTSKESKDQINNTVSLTMFMNHFKLVVEPWKSIQKHSITFNNVFKEADEEYKKIYIQSTGNPTI